MSDELRRQNYNELSLRETEDLLEIWRTNDHEEWSDTAFELIKEILTERLGEVPLQDLPSSEEEDDNNQNNGFEKWEARLLDDENQPEFYDTVEVLSLRDSLNRVAIGIVVGYTLLGLFSLQIVSAFLRGLSIPYSEILRLLPYDLLTILNFGLRIVVIYFSLKALTYILRILMEMEFNSRKGTEPKPSVE